MPMASWFKVPRGLPPLFLAVTLIPGISLGWLTWKLVQMDRRLDGQRLEEQAERAADRVVAASHQRLADLDAELRRLATDGESRPPEGTLLVYADAGGGVTAPNGGVAFLPVLPVGSEPDQAIYSEGERREYQARDAAGAISWFAALARRSTGAVRAGALVRLARNQRREGAIVDALDTYRELEQLGATVVEGYPSAVLALAARCDLLAQVGRQAELRQTAHALRAGLGVGEWPLTRDAYDFYTAQARKWTGEAETEAERHARTAAAAFEWAYREWTESRSPPQQQALIVEGRPVLVASMATPSRFAVLIANADYLRDAWRDLVDAEVWLTAPDGQAILGEPAPVALAVRPTEDGRLPWTVRVASTNLETNQAEDTARRRLLFGGLLMVLVLFGGSTYFALRGVSREVAAARLQADFVAAVSHEFRTPLASVRHLSEMLATDRIGHHAERQAAYGFLSRESERLERLVEDVLDFGRIEGGEYEYRFDRLDVSELLRTVVSEFEPRARESGHRVELSTPDGPVAVRADREAVGRAIRNLLDNAVKYSPETDTVRVEVRREDEAVVIDVQDQGVGIAADEQRAIFRKFVRGRNALDRRIKGTGIGLAMVSQIMAAHRGAVRVDSQPNQGSTFSLVLPLRAVDGVPQEQSS